MISFRDSTTQSGLQSKTTSTHIDNAKKEAINLPKKSLDTSKEMEENSQNLDSKSMTIRKINSLFSIAFSELQSIRNESISQREMGIRFEEMLDILKIKVNKVLGDI
jgi:hypothetical protein